MKSSILIAVVIYRTIMCIGFLGKKNPMCFNMTETNLVKFCLFMFLVGLLLFVV